MRCSGGRGRLAPAAGLPGPGVLRTSLPCEAPQPCPCLGSRSGSDQPSDNLADPLAKLIWSSVTLLRALLCFEGKRKAGEPKREACGSVVVQVLLHSLAHAERERARLGPSALSKPHAGLGQVTSPWSLGCQICKGN